MKYNCECLDKGNMASVCLLTHCGLVTSYGDMDLGEHWLR